MGASQSQGTQCIDTEEERQRVFTMPAGMLMLKSGVYASDALATHVAISPADALARGLSDEEDRAAGCLLGLAVGDALGAPLEFIPVRYPGDQLPIAYSTPPAGFEQESLWADKSDTRESNRFLLERGQWTDDTAMALCLADSLLANAGAFHPRDLRMRFALWWGCGYNNAFGRDENRRAYWGHLGSVGCGGMVGNALEEFSRLPCDYTHEGDSRSSGNGTIMRLAPVPILCRHDVEAAMELAWCQSKTTHQGDEAADCSRLLAWLCARAISSGDGRAVLDQLGAFPARLYSTRCLAKSLREESHEENAGLDLAGRDWCWRGRVYRYYEPRIAADRGYAGSYCMDGLAMALHCVYSTESFEAAVHKAANMCGDADTVAAITGQIAGAIYGASAIPSAWTDAIGQWEQPHGSIRHRAWLLCQLTPPTASAVHAHERADDGSWPAFEQRLADAARSQMQWEADCAAPQPLPLQCACGRGFANATLMAMHKRKCAAFLQQQSLAVDVV